MDPVSVVRDMADDERRACYGWLHSLSREHVYALAAEEVLNDLERRVADLSLDVMGLAFAAGITPTQTDPNFCRFDEMPRDQLIALALHKGMVTPESRTDAQLADALVDLWSCEPGWSFRELGILSNLSDDDEDEE